MDINTIFKYMEVPRFYGENYACWSINMKHLLKEKRIWEIIEGGYEYPPT